MANGYNPNTQYFWNDPNYVDNTGPQIPNWKDPNYKPETGLTALDTLQTDAAGGYTPPPTGVGAGMFQAPTEIGYGAIPQFEKVPYQSAYSPTFWEEQRGLVQQGIQAGFEPAKDELDVMLAGIRERARKQQGAGSGLITEAQRAPQEAFTKQMARESAAGMRSFESQRLQAQMEDLTAKSKWEMGEGATGRDFTLGQYVDRNSWNRADQTRVQQTNIEQMFKQGLLSREDAMTQWQANENERVRIYNEARDAINKQIDIAVAKQARDEEAQLKRDMQQIDLQMQKDIAAANAKAAMWGAIIGTAGKIIAAKSGQQPPVPIPA